MSTVPAEIESMRPETAKMLERLYFALVEQVNLTPGQRGMFYQLLLDNKMKGLGQKTDFLRHGDIARLSRNVADIQKEMEAGLQTLLGVAGFSQYQQYQAGIGDRSSLELIRNDFAQHPLTGEQEQLLLQAMDSGRKALCGDAGGGDAGFSMADTSEVMEQKLTRRASIDQHVLQQAAGFLSPAQLEILSAAQDRLRTWRRNGYAKIKAMFGNQGNSETGPA
jgi:hypothetical protein